MGIKHLKSTQSKIAPNNLVEIRNIVSIWMSKIFMILLPLIATPIILKSLGLEVYAIWAVAAQLSAQLLLFDAGLINSLVRLFAKYENSETKLISIFSISLMYLLFISTLLIFSTIFFTLYHNFNL